MTLTPEQAARRSALIERISTIADLSCAKPLQGELGDVAYDLLRQAAAQLSSDAMLIETQAAEIAALRERVSQIANLGSCVHAKTPQYKLFQQAIDIAMGAP